MRPVGDWPVALITMRVCRRLPAPRSCPDAHRSSLSVPLDHDWGKATGSIQADDRHHARLAPGGGHQGGQARARTSTQSEPGHAMKPVHRDGDDRGGLLGYLPRTCPPA